LPLEAARSRRKTHADRMESRDELFHARVRAGFLAEAAKRPDRIVVLDAGEAPDKVQDRIRRATEELLKKDAAVSNRVS
jgi:dTMP kinase